MKLEPPFPDAFVIRDGLVVDGSGTEPDHSDLVVDKGVLEIQPPGSVSGLPILDADGLAVTPGFIDAHSHADLEPFASRHDPALHASRLVQGVTTEVTGNCGFSPFPVLDSDSGETAAFLGILFGDSALTFRDLDSYSAAIESEGLASNIAPLVGHGTLRAMAVGMGDRPPDQRESEAMRRALAASLDGGAFGLSTGLCYSPATFASAAEIEALAAVVSRAGAIYATHVRNETDGIREALREAFEAGEKTGVRLHVSHLKAAGRANWGQADSLLAAFDQARADGIDVTTDVYPYAAGSTMLHSLLPPWLTDQGLDTMLTRLADPGVRLRIAEELTNGVAGWQNLGSAAGWERVTIASSPTHRHREGRSVTELRNSSDTNVADTIARLLLDEGGRVVAVIEVMRDEDVRAILAWRHTLVGSDGIPLPGTPHPRLTGTFPRALSGHRTDPLPRMVQKMTGGTAERFGIPGRGFLRSGFVADVVLIDAETVEDRGTYADPWQPPTGIKGVLISGAAAVWDTHVIATAAGRVLRRERASDL